METKQYTDERGKETGLLTGMAFLAENPEAYGLVPDACPVVTADLLLAVNGHGAMGGAISPTYPVEEKGVDGLLDTLYGNLIPRTDENARLLRATFGESEGMQEHPVARYCAALAEATALRVFDGTAKGASAEQLCRMLGEEIPRRLARLRETVCGDGVTPRDDEFFSVSLGACRMIPDGGGNYRVDIFSAGDFHVYLLDGDGLHPLWTEKTPVLFPDKLRSPAVRSLTLRHPEPFNVVIDLGKSLALALEFKMGAEIINTVIIRDLKELAILAIVILIRALLAVIIHWEIKMEKQADRNEAPPDTKLESK